MGRLLGKGTIERDAQRLRPLIGSQRGYRIIPVRPSIQPWDGATNKASQTLDLQGAGFGLPSGIKMVHVYLVFTTGTPGDYAALRTVSGEPNQVLARVLHASYGGDGAGWVVCDGSGDIYFYASTGTNTVYLYINAYAL